MYNIGTIPDTSKAKVCQELVPESLKATVGLDSYALSTKKKKKAKDAFLN